MLRSGLPRERIALPVSLDGRPMKFKPGTRRDFFRDAIGDWVERLMDQAEGRVVGRRYVRPPGALPEVGFLAACTREAFGERLRTGVLYRRYSAWAASTGRPSMTQKMFSRRLKIIGVRSTKSNFNYWLDLALLPQPEPSGDQP